WCGAARPTTGCGSGAQYEESRGHGSGASADGLIRPDPSLTLRRVPRLRFALGVAALNQLADRLAVVEDVHGAAVEAGDGGGSIDAEMLVEVGKNVAWRIGLACGPGS